MADIILEASLGTNTNIEMSVTLGEWQYIPDELPSRSQGRPWLKIL
jgi:hypothetical protein